MAQLFVVRPLEDVMHIRAITIIIAACLHSAAAAEPPVVIDLLGPGKRSHPTSATLKQCPDGHTTLKDVPIIYGTPPFDGPAAEHWQRSIQKYDMWSGGCLKMPDSPTVRPTCTTCGFGYDSHFGHWSRASADIWTFKRSFSPLVASFPKPGATHQKGAFRYTQSVSTNRVVSQSVSFTSSEPRDSLVGRINAWFKTNGITTSYTEGEHTVTFDGSQKLISDRRAESVRVMFQHMKKDGDSWVMLNVSSR